jgi:uncharacterized membrane protein
MNNSERINQIKTENYIWIIYLIIIGLSYCANFYETEYFLNNEPKNKENYRLLNIIVFGTLIVVYSYFEKESYKELLKETNSKTKKQYEELIFIASTFILISGLIFFYIAIKDENLETEIAFN